MFCFQCGCALNDSNRCPNCGVNVASYKKIIYTSNRLYNDGLEKAKVRDLSGAVVSLKESLWCNKYNTDARNLLGLVYYEMGEMVAALSEWVISHNYQPKDNKADLLLEQVQTTAQITNINQIIGRYNTALEAAYNGNYDVAQIQLRRVIQMNPHYIRAHQLLALLHIHDQNWNRALKVLQKCQALDQNNTTTLRYLQEVQRQISSDTDLQGGLRKVTELGGGVVSYTDGNETIIQPSGARSPGMEESRIPAGVINLLIGLLVGAAVVGFLILPARVQATRNKGAEEVRAISEQLDARNVQIQDLNTEISKLNAQEAELQERLAEYESTTDSLSASDALMLAANQYLTEPDDLDSFNEDFAGIGIDKRDTGSEAFRILYDTLLEKEGPALREYYTKTGMDAYNADTPDYAAAAEALALALSYRDPEAGQTDSSVLFAYANSVMNRYGALPEAERAGSLQDLTPAKEALEQLLNNDPESDEAEDAQNLLKQINDLLQEQND
ncbi:MAG: tetratricopeptide repeat protein [Lachnospiraceae bacterium]|nr:tetratricopeptide repeat protein [Lachnospiraceae bacterium]